MLSKSLRVGNTYWILGVFDTACCHASQLPISYSNFFVGFIAPSSTTRFQGWRICHVSPDALIMKNLGCSGCIHGESDPNHERRERWWLKSNGWVLSSLQNLWELMLIHAISWGVVPGTPSSGTIQKPLIAQRHVHIWPVVQVPHDRPHRQQNDNYLKSTGAAESSKNLSNLFCILNLSQLSEMKKH